MDLFRNRRKYLIILGALFLAFYILPNIFNFREARYFSDNKRVASARELSGRFKDSIQIIPGEYYQRSELYMYFFGKKNRELWTTPVMLGVFNYDTIKGGLQPFEIGGSQQTISIRLKDSSGKNWVLRSVNKDQRGVLNWWLRASILRPVFRDQVSAMNPYAAMIVARLSTALHLPHTDPELYWVPFVEKHRQYNERIAGRMVYLEQNIDSSWKEVFNASDIVDTEAMETMSDKEKIQVDTLLYLKTRLFDMLINDWDRHKGQWRWILTTARNGSRLFKPIAKDRDMAFYIFDEGLINRLAINVKEKFQSFRNGYANIKGLMHQSEKLDKKILKGVDKQYFIAAAAEISSQLDSASIHSAFAQYPPVIRNKFSEQHATILRSRLSRLSTAASTFYELVNKD